MTKLKAIIKSVDQVSDKRTAEQHIQIEVEFKGRGKPCIKKYMLIAPGEVEDVMQRIRNDKEQLEMMEDAFDLLKSKEGENVSESF